MLDRHSRNWWVFALRGVLAIAFGLFALFLPGITLLALVLLFAAYAIVDGVFSVAAGLRGATDRQPDWWLIVGGVAGIIAGILAVIWPNITALVLLIFIGAWAIVSGAAALVAAYRLRDRIRGELLLAIEGLVSIAFGVLILVMPSAGALAVVWLIGAYAIASGVLLLALAVRLYQRERDRSPASGGATAAT